MSENINGRIVFVNTDLTLEYASAATAGIVFDSLQRAANAKAMTLWVRRDGRCDFIQFTPNGG